jgi:hypothetical protein
LLLQAAGERAEAQRVYEEVRQLVEYGPRHQRRAQRQWYELAKQQLASL